MKKYILLVPFIFGLLVTPILAQNIEPTSDVSEATVTVPSGIDEYFDVELEVGTQSPWTKKVPVTLKFRSYITADKTELNWDAPVGLDVRTRHPQFVAVSEGEVYSYKANIKPKEAGRYEIAANVTAWQYNTNYTSSDSISLEFGEDLVTVPETVGYQAAKLTRIVLIAVVIISIVIAIALFSKKGVKMLKKWLKPPE